MVVCCWSVKGGVGTSVVTAALALLTARRGEESLIVDLAGDQPALLGVDSDRPGLLDWLAAGDDVAVDSLRRLEIPVGPRLGLLAAGEVDQPPRFEPGRLAVAVAIADRPGRRTFVDLGVLVPGGARASMLDGAQSVLVTRACYLALRRARALPITDDLAVVLVEEPGRALGHRDVAQALGVDRVWRVAWDPAVARAVDAGTMAGRIPGGLRRLEKML